MKDSVKDECERNRVKKGETYCTNKLLLCETKSKGPLRSVISDKSPLERAEVGYISNLNKTVGKRRLMRNRHDEADSCSMNILSPPR